MAEAYSGQLNFEGKLKDQVAIERLQAFEPPDGYWLAFSGGKDSVVIYDLAKRSGVKFQAYYNWTGIDPPELLAFVKNKYSDVIILKPLMTMWDLIEKKGMLPLRQRRFCCEYLKERSSRGHVVVTGVRWQESFKRSKRRLVETCFRDGLTSYLHPIIEWSATDVWAYIRERQIPYCQLYDEGFKRLGCVLCPMTSHKIAKIELLRWPKIALSWRHAAQRLCDSGKISRAFQDGDKYFEWWLSRKSSKKKEGQCVMFHD